MGFGSGDAAAEARLTLLGPYAVAGVSAAVAAPGSAPPPAGPPQPYTAPFGRQDRASGSEGTAFPRI
jgi:hypothetical protein